MKHMILTLLALFCVSVAFCSEVEEVKVFFDRYTKSANNYQKTVPLYYSNNAKIIRIVIKPNGEKESIEFPMSDYTFQMNKSSKLAKFVKYRNTYKNIEITKMDDEKYKITAIRYPNKDKEGLNAHFIIKKTNDGYKIIEEAMETKRQEFLKYKNY